MSDTSFVVTRRLVLTASAAAVTVMAAPKAWAQDNADAVLFTISDLHAPYARFPALLDTIREMRADVGVPAALLINGDIFERGNVVCLRSGGVADWAFLSALASEMPVIVNLGNHETAIMDDMATFTALADQAGIRVISNLVDRRTGQFFAPVSDRLGLGGINISLLGLAATNPFVYRTAVRDTLTFLDTAQFVDDIIADASAGADLTVIMSHAGVSADKSFLGNVPSGTLVQGAHDHLTLNAEENGVSYFHVGSWGTQLGVVSLKKADDTVQATYETVPIAPRDGNTALADVIAAQKTEHLTDEDTDVIANVPNDMDMHSSILLATDALRAATDADVAMIGHTTFGAPLAAGPLTKYDFDAFVRFGGPLKVASVQGDILADMLGRANQFAAQTLDERTGDYVHVAELDIDTSQTYRLAVNAWTAVNQAAYLGTEDITFEDVESLELKSVISDHLARAFPYPP